ncbi:translation initiation factor IF-3 [Patescibacteria group bacterium]|nr:translation initiation factor IF-3 [Patescibacteria group bacterium]
MRIHYKRRRTAHKFDNIKFQYNERIRVPEVRVIDEQGTFHGIMKTADALALAEERGFDLVEVSPKEEPPVCKLLDYGAFKYQKIKEMKQQKIHAKKVEVKGIRLSVKIGQHDIDNRVKQAIEFLKGGQKIKIEIILRGREKAHGDLALQKIQEFIDGLSQTYELFIEQPPKRQGGNVSAIIGRKS